MAVDSRVLPTGKVLAREFYARSSPVVARELLGAVLVHGETAGRIVETEAYLGEFDGAAHAARGLTPRTKVLFGPPGHAYVYLVYGMYECLNVVAEPEGVPGCVLIRALEPLAGIEQMRQRRGVNRAEDLASGPGKLTIALAITRALNGADVTAGALRVLQGRPPQEPVIACPRVGIRHAVDWPLRFLLAGNRFVSKPRPRSFTLADL